MSIPLVTWLNIFFVAFALKSVGNLIKIYVVSNLRSSLVFELVRVTVADGFLLAWVYSIW